MKARLITWLPPGVALTLFVAASIATAIYYGNTWTISYPTPVSIGLLWEHRDGVGLPTLRQAWSTAPYDIAFLGTTAAWPLLLTRRSRRTALLAAILPVVLLFPVNVIGAYVGIVELIMWQRWNGETLAEGWPLVELYGLWSLWSFCFLVHVIRRGSRTAVARPAFGARDPAVPA